MKFEDMYQHDKYANDAGMAIVELNDQHAVMSFTVEKHHLNGVNMLHGGAVFLLADVTMAAMANYKQSPSVSIQSDIRFLAAGREGDVITAEAVEVFGRKTLYNSRATITNQRGELIAVAEGMFYTKQAPPKETK